MEGLFKYIIDQTSQGKIDKNTAVQLVKQIKQTEFKEADDIAIIGMSGRMPLANTLDEYWENIKSGLDCISAFPESRSRDITNYLRAVDPEQEIHFHENGFIEEVDKFDYKFFKFSLKEASLMDPNQRIFLETVWQAIEDAGYGGNRLTGSNTGVYAGFASSLRDLYLKQIYDVEPTAIPMSMVGNLAAVLPSRISYLLDLHGPSMVIDTACSSSLVAINLACEALRNGKCDMAIAGGVKLNLMPIADENMKIGIESTDGRTRAFSDDSNGSGIGEGVTAIVLKPLKKAIKDGDSIYAIIKGVAMNQDGNSVGYTAPNPASQTDVILKAWEDAKVPPETITYVETHGTGTKLGDPIEIKGLQDAFRKFTDKTQFCAVGSLKTNIGHASEAAGMLSVIKTVLALKHKQLPPSLNFDKPNRTIRFTESPVYVNTALRDWETGGEPRRCGVSAFGISGTNCHVVLEEAPAVTGRQSSRTSNLLLTLSAKSEEALQQQVSNYLTFLQNNPDLNLADVCYTANTGRGHYQHRLAIPFNSREELLQKLQAWSAGGAELAGIRYGTFKVGSSLSAKQDPSFLSEQDKAMLDSQATRLIASREAFAQTEEAFIQELIELYTRGADFSWDVLYEKDQHMRLHLPTYPFERTRCWINLPEYIPAAEEAGEEDRFYSVFWQPSHLETDNTVQEEKTILLFKDGRGYWRDLQDRLQTGSQNIVLVEFGERFEKRGENAFVIRGVEEDYDALLEGLAAGELSRIIHLGTISEREELSRLDDLQVSQQRSVYSLFYLVRALVRKGLDQGVDVSLISEHVYGVTAEQQTIRPERAPFFGIGKAINHEHPGLRFRCIDIDHNWSVEDVLKEMYHRSETYQVAYRQGQRYIEVFSEVQVVDEVSEPVMIKENGVYLITGGLGGIGLEITKHFAGKNRVRIAMLNRTALPPRDEWEQILQSGADPKLCKRIEAIREVESLGSEVVCYSADIANEQEVQRAIEGIRQRYGKIDGIIHAAGIPGEGFLFKKSNEAFDRVLSPKVFGTWILDRLTAQEELDFMVLFSSGLSILSEPGHGDYTAANAYLDSFAAARNKQGKKTLAINWTTWKETGMAVDYGFNYDSIFKAITTEEALQGFDIALSQTASTSHLLIGQFSYIPQFLFMMDRLPFQLSDKIRRKFDKVRKENGIQSGQRKENRTTNRGGVVELTGKDGAEISEIERKVAQVYNEVLGFQEINIYDSFFELGGDSVMLNHMHAILDKEFPDQIKLIDLFNYTSVHALSQFLTSKIEGVGQSAVQTMEEELAAFSDMFEAIEKGDLSIEDALKNFNE